MEIERHVQIMGYSNTFLKIIKDSGGLDGVVKSVTLIQFEGLNCEGVLNNICFCMK